MVLQIYTSYFFYYFFFFHPPQLWVLKIFKPCADSLAHKKFKFSICSSCNSLWNWAHVSSIVDLNFGPNFGAQLTLKKIALYCEPICPSFQPSKAEDLLLQWESTWSTRASWRLLLAKHLVASRKLAPTLGEALFYSLFSLRFFSWETDLSRYWFSLKNRLLH